MSANTVTSGIIHTDGQQSRISEIAMPPSSRVATSTRSDLKTVSEEEEANLRMAIEACQILQSLIDIHFNNIIGLRTQSDVSLPSVQEEIRHLEVSEEVISQKKRIVTQLPWLRTNSLDNVHNR